jgi:hypothetical protein
MTLRDFLGGLVVVCGRAKEEPDPEDELRPGTGGGSIKPPLLAGRVVLVVMLLPDARCIEFNAGKAGGLSVS